ncbi:MAG: hypothetical protein BVN34_02875 [Proteobacteria bacterium ST_bin12]|nr:MAG: hypothetical protein BVN34_02875 [Proteobacteria bacterium ST_bin12]
MELAPVSNKSAPAASSSAENNSDIFSITSTFKPNELTSTSKKSATSKASAKSAANVFAAKRIESNNRNAVLALIAGVGLCALLAAAAYFYLFMDKEPDFIVAKPAAILPEALPATSESALESQPPINAADLSAQSIAESAAEKQTAPITFAETETLIQTVKPSNKKQNTQVFNNENLTENEVMQDEMRIEKSAKVQSSQLSSANQPKQNASKVVEIEEIASKSASIQVSKTKPELGVNPILMGAFNAYNVGNDAVASKLYRQVLQRDLRNVDALMGLGAIAQRQGRVADANGWYAKVLEVEPRNALATSAILDSQPQNDVASNESRIKNMLAKQPDDANLHATLGNFYADLNQWPAAQQAYFDAYRLNASADNSFNLGVSLDQLGKPKLALPYYQRALELSQSTASKIDKVALEARITAIQ